MVGESPAVILYDGYGHPVGTVLDGVFYRLQVEAKLAPSSNTIGKIDQGVAGADPWLVNVSSSSLPAGAATEATLVSKLADTTFTSRINTLGQKTMSNSTPVVIASNQSPLSVNVVSGGASSILKVLYDIGVTEIYVGTAPQGTTTSSSAWTIKKITLDVDGNPIIPYGSIGRP
jgi:hypothetical protein